MKGQIARALRRSLKRCGKKVTSPGVLPLKDPLEGIEVDIKIARIRTDVRSAD